MIARFRELCRRLGFGLIGVGADRRGGRHPQPVAAPCAATRSGARGWSRSTAARRRSPLGGSTRGAVMTAYRQLARTCDAALAEGPRRPSSSRRHPRGAPGILTATSMGGSSEPGRGVYAITDEGRAALAALAERGGLIFGCADAAPHPPAGTFSPLKDGEKSVTRNDSSNLPVADWRNQN